MFVVFGCDFNERGSSLRSGFDLGSLIFIVNAGLVFIGCKTLTRHKILNKALELGF